MSEFYDWNGVPISMDRWRELFETIEDRQVANTDLGPLGHVSTVWLGLDYSWGSGPPLIFETMVFGGPLDQTMDRYSTVEDAQMGHEFFVLALSSMGPPARRKQLIHKGRKP